MIVARSLRSDGAAMKVIGNVEKQGLHLFAGIRQAPGCLFLLRLGGKSVTGYIKELAEQRQWASVARLCRCALRNLQHPIGRRIYNRRMLVLIDLRLVANATRIDWVARDVMDVASTKGPTARDAVSVMSEMAEA